MMWEGAGFEVVDLGVNVSPEAFVAAVREHRPRILGLSALRQAAPFIFSMNPPTLVLSHCTARLNEAGDKAS